MRSPFSLCVQPLIFWFSMPSALFKEKWVISSYKNFLSKYQSPEILSLFFPDTTEIQSFSTLNIPTTVMRAFSSCCYTQGFFFYRISTFIRKRKTHSSWRHILAPFSPRFWWVVSASLIVFTVTLSATWYISLSFGFQESSEHYTIYNSWLCIF
jgi:hypothetical protein